VVACVPDCSGSNVGRTKIRAKIFRHHPTTGSNHGPAGLQCRIRDAPIQVGLLGDVDVAKALGGLWGMTYQRLQDDASRLPNRAGSQTTGMQRRMPYRSERIAGFAVSREALTRSDRAIHSGFHVGIGPSALGTSHFF